MPTPGAPPRRPSLAANGFYEQRGKTAARVVQRHMSARWGQPQNAGGQVFAPGYRVDAAVQGTVQDDNYRYEISYWYDGQDVYVLFHCY